MFRFTVHIIWTDADCGVLETSYQAFNSLAEMFVQSVAIDIDPTLAIVASTSTCHNFGQQKRQRLRLRRARDSTEDIITRLTVAVAGNWSDIQARLNARLLELAKQTTLRLDGTKYRYTTFPVTKHLVFAYNTAVNISAVGAAALASSLKGMVPTTDLPCLSFK